MTESSSSDPLDLERFVVAQHGVYEQALRELRIGRKTSHWMWFVFPQIIGLGHSPMAVRYAISGADEARAYLAHPVLGSRLRECTEAVLAVEDRTPYQIFGSPDDLKFRSSLTLFAACADEPSVFQSELNRFYDDGPDELTLEHLGKEPKL